MAADGSALEQLVAFIERQVGPGLSVTTREVERDANGVALAEFDVVVEGKLGTGAFAWLIECRDRPSDGSAPRAWIEQLVGRKLSYRFDKVTAVSTTGYSPGAAALAEQWRIELREVRSLSAADFAQAWPSFQGVKLFTRIAAVHQARFGMHADTPRDAMDFVNSTTRPGDEKYLRSTKDGSIYSVGDAFQHAAEQAGLMSGPPREGPPLRIGDLEVIYQKEDHYVIDTPMGEAHIAAINFSGEIRYVLSDMPVADAFQYQRIEGCNSVGAIAQTARYEVTLPSQAANSLELKVKRIEGLDDAFVEVRAIRNLPDSAAGSE